MEASYSLDYTFLHLEIFMADILDDSFEATTLDNKLKAIDDAKMTLFSVDNYMGDSNDGMMSEAKWDKMSKKREKMRGQLEKAEKNVNAQVNEQNEGQ